MSKKKTELVVKSNKIIEASYRLNLVEQQIILFAICRSREDQTGFSSDTPVTITAANFAAQFGTDTNSVYSQLKEAVRTLYDRSITIHDIDPKTGHKRVTETRWISDKSYIDGAGQIQLTFAAKVIPFITRLGESGEFTAYRLEKIGGMSSAHAVRLYELLVQYLSIGTREIEINWLKQALQLEDEYPRLGNFKQRVIDVAVSQINECSDLTVSYTQKKSGRVVTHFIFEVKIKSDTPKKTKKINIDKEYVERHANPGESYEQAYKRLSATSKN
jgi:plasmid replication initiation protein